MTETVESLNTEKTFCTIGPVGRELPGLMRLYLELDGEVISSGKVEIGFLHRGLEKAFERVRWSAATSYADRLDAEGAIFGELALCLAVEEIAGISVPKRAQDIRVILSELGRVSSHMEYIVRVAQAVGSDTMVHYVLRDREKVLDLQELLTGARYSLNFLRYGGVRADVTEGFIERLLEVCELLKIRVKEYNDLFTYNHAYIKRTERVAVLGLDRAKALGITGPNARASGASFDIRKKYPYCGYDKIDFEVPVGPDSAGDANQRFLIRLRELSVSVEILKQMAEAVSPGEIRSTQAAPDIQIPAGEAFSQVESSRGTLGCHVVSGGGVRPARVQFRTPSMSAVTAIPELIEGLWLEDLPAVLASLGLAIGEVDK